MRHIFKCIKCGAYTMKEKCSCGENAVTTKPAKYSPDDRFSSYRRTAKREILEGEDLL
jgi:H/ACA ribonucleoprotein complex subunit 3